MRIVFNFCFLILLILNPGCSSKSDKKFTSDSIPGNSGDKDSFDLRGPQKQIIIYGSTQCVHCHQFRRKLDSKGIKYEFRDVDKNDAFYLELQNKLKSIDFDGYVQYPVLDIEGEIFINPTFSETEDKMFRRTED